jgi:hypothetical protein
MPYSRFSHFTLITATLCALSGCGSSDSTPEPAPPEAQFNITASGLPGLTVVAFMQHDGDVWAASDDGIYTSGDGGDSWQAAGLQGLHVQDFVSFDDQQFYALAIDAGDNQTTLLYESLDAGESWQLVANNFTDPDTVDNSRPQVLLADPANDFLYAAGQRAVARSLDRGRTWELIDGEWGIQARTSALAINDINQTLWHGGQGSIENHYLRRVSLSNDVVMQWDNIFPNPATINSIQFAPNDADTTIVTGEGGVAVQRGNNANWETPLGDVNHRFYWDLIIDPDEPDHWFTAGWHKAETAQQFILEYSTDNGRNWQQYTHPPADHPYGVRSMVLLEQQPDEGRVFLLGVSGGLDVGGGVLKAQVILP